MYTLTLSLLEELPLTLTCIVPFPSWILFWLIEHDRPSALQPLIVKPVVDETWTLAVTIKDFPLCITSWSIFLSSTLNSPSPDEEEPGK